MVDTYIHADDTTFLTEKIAKLEAENQRMRKALKKIKRRTGRIKYPHQLLTEINGIAKKTLKGGE